MRKKLTKEFAKLPQFTEMTDIDELISSPDTTLRNLLFSNIVYQQHPRLMEYYTLHIDDVISYVLLTQPVEQVFHLAALRLFFCNFDFFISRTHALKVFYDYAFNLDQYSEPSHVSYFSIIHNIIFQSPNPNSNLRDEFKSKEYFEALFGRIDILQIYLFLFRIIQQENFSVKSLLFNSNRLFSLLSNFLYSDSSKIAQRSQILLLALIRTNSISEPADHFLQSNFLDQYIHHILMNPSKNGFLFLRDLFNLSIESTYRLFYYVPNRSKKWMAITQIISTYSTHFSVLLQDTDVFNETILGCATLFFLIVYYQRDVSDVSVEILQKFWQMFFNFPTNNFLHIMFTQIFKGLNERKLLTKKMIEKLDMVNQIVHQYQMRPTICAAYWGHLKMISTIINGSFKINNKEWSEIVIKENKRLDKIISQPYGGEIIKARKVPLSLYLLLVFIVILIVLIAYLAFQ